MDLSILIVSFNTRELTLACLRSLPAACGGLAHEVIVVDNASTDGTVEAIRTELPHVRLLAEEENLGFARANNLGARSARGEFLLLLNSDTEAFEGSLARMVEFARAHPQASLVGGRTVFADGSLNPQSCWGRPTLRGAFSMACGLGSLFRRTRLFDPESLGRWKRDSAREVDIVSGCFLLLRKSLWDRLDGFDPAFFMYAEDYDLCLRAAALGGRSFLCPEAVIVHHGGASEKLRADKLARLFRARAQLFAKHWRPAAARLGVLSLDLWAGSRALAFTILERLRLASSASRETWGEVWRRRREWRVLEAGGTPAGRRARAGLPVAASHGQGGVEP